VRRRLALLLAVVTSAPLAVAHDGPPYPILVDELIGDWTASVWADPDVGIGTFYFYLPETSERSWEGLTLAAIVQPTDGRLAEARHVADTAEEGQPYQRIALVDFDARGPWQIRFEIAHESAPDELLGQVSTIVDVTPPGLGRVDVLWFLMPFVLIGLLWLKAIQQRRAYRRSVA